MVKFSLFGSPVPTSIGSLPSRFKISCALNPYLRLSSVSSPDILSLKLEGNDPILVGTGDPNKLNLTTDYMIPILVNAVKELDKELVSLKNENQNLKERLTLIEQKIN